MPLRGPWAVSMEPEHFVLADFLPTERQLDRQMISRRLPVRT